ncbi:MAG: ATP-grasp domain-containing protein [Clostridia bacterium]|nr:ATP-grasp domain-containing protein [Clostridia bacterium]
MFSKILVANRGEIAVKIINTCKNMEIATVAVYSEADKDALHTKVADECYCIGKSEPKESYLNMEAIISVALATGAQAIHPGYGFLSENYEFASLCEENDICFIGPPSNLLKKMSNKAMAKKIAKRNKLAVIEGICVKYDLPEILKSANKIGYPIVIKPTSGGAGRGIKVLHNEEETQNFVNNSEKVFYTEEVLIEKYVAPASHIEVQIIADKYGNALCLGERDCSIQDQNQKLLEETPCSKIDKIQREQLFESCIHFVKSIKYVGCGTLEFLLDTDGFHFMEMNCRIQVEHPITEMVTGLNLIKMQILIAYGKKLTLQQKDVKFTGCALESRINFCDLQGNNIVTNFKFNKNANVRFETCIYKGYNVPVFYDHLLGKLIVHAKTRSQAISKMEKALSELVIEGISTNINLHKNILNNEIFKKHQYDTDFFNLYYKKKYLSAQERLDMIIDKGTLVEYDSEITSDDILNFDGYMEKLERSKKITNMNEAVVYGKAKIDNIDVVIFVMDGNFMMGTMGRVVGEKIKRAFVLATEKRLPIIGVTVSGGARMQEGVFSLLQMAKTAAFVKKHSDKGLLYISVITNPTLGGVSASFASLADIIIAEEKAIFGFTGKRIIEDVTKATLPEDFQTAEYSLTHGMVDMVTSRDKLRDYLKEILKIHKRDFYEKKI